MTANVSEQKGTQSLRTEGMTEGKLGPGERKKTRAVLFLMKMLQFLNWNSKLMLLRVR